MQSNKDHAVYSDLFSSKRKCKPEGYHAVCVSDYLFDNLYGRREKLDIFLFISLFRDMIGNHFARI
jgi:hypothetical protein